MQEKLILFDLDGTLIDTLKDLNASTNYALKKHGFPLKNLEETRKSVGNGNRKLIERSVPNPNDEKLVDECLEDFKKHYLVHFADLSTPYEGMKDTLLELKRRNYLLGVVTNKFNDAAIALIEKFYPGIFSIIQGKEEHLRTKPHSDMINSALQKLNKDVKIMAFIGDSDVDFETAITAHIPAILVSYGFKGRTFLENKTKGVPIIDTPQELLNYFD